MVFKHIVINFRNINYQRFEGTNLDVDSILYKEKMLPKEFGSKVVMIAKHLKKKGVVKTFIALAWA